METPFMWIPDRYQASAGRPTIALAGAIVTFLLAIETIRRSVLVVVLIGSLAACAGHGSSTPSISVVASPPTASGNPTVTPTSSGNAFTVTGIDYAFQGVPETAPAGTVVTFVNAGKEVHQIAVARRNDGVTATVDELLAMPQAESDKLVTILGAAVASPGETAPDKITLDRPGSYVFVCFIPVGTMALPSLAPGATPGEGQLPDGPPHFVQGMIAELTVTDATSEANPSAPSGTSSPSAGAESFLSTRHGYRVDVPPGWVVNEYPGSWDDLAQFTPGAEIPGEDVIAPRDFSSFLVMNSMPIPAGMSGAEWEAAFEGIVAAGLPADCSITTEPGTFAGEPATIVDQICEDVALVGRSLVHGGRGYYITTLSPHPDPAGAAVVEELAASIEFTQ